MALYAIAREEMDGVQDACAKLKKTVSHLNEISGDIHYRASAGINSALKDFKEQNNEALRQTLYKATEGLEQTCHYAKNRLNNQDILYLVICYVAGVITALLGMYIWNGEQLSKIENNQLQMIREVAALRPKISKQIVKHRRKVATQKNDVADE